MLCCGVCGKMSKRDYKVATTDGIELEPLGGPKPDKDNKTNGVKFSEYFLPFIIYIMYIYDLKMIFVQDIAINV